MAKKIKNDNISDLLGGIDKKFTDTDDFLDIVQWNLRWFNAKETARAKKIESVLSVLNSDIFVFQEIAMGSLDGIAESLSKNGKGHYEVAYGTTGGQQRVAVMWDMDWVRQKDDARELFGKHEVLTPDGKDVFPRLPLWNYFICRSAASLTEAVDFQLVGLHLKSQMDREGKGEDQLQRTLSAKKLMSWLMKDGNKMDADVIMLGDWNEPPSAEAWEVIRKAEKEKRLKFSTINDESDFSHLYYRNINDVGSLLDLRVVTSSFSKQMSKSQANGTIHWLSLEELLESGAGAGQVKKLITEIKNDITDHMPVLTRFNVKHSAKKK